MRNAACNTGPTADGLRILVAKELEYFSNIIGTIPPTGLDVAFLATGLG